MRKSWDIKIAGQLLRFYIAPVLAYICVMPILLALADWQFVRAGEKQHLLDVVTRNAGQESILLPDLINGDMEKLRYKKIRLFGHYDQAHQFLLDNQIRGGKAGYFVLTPFISQADGRLVLVNRGWLPLNPDRKIRPELPVHDRQIMLVGRINQFPGVGIKLPGAEIPSDNWPSLVQLVDIGQISKKLNFAVIPMQVELDEDQPDGFNRDWQTASVMQPEQHIAYAFQWLGLALTLTILFIWYSFKNNHD